MFLVLLTAVGGVATPISKAQFEPPERGFAPPVHIPPREAVRDPGLPRTLNGRFNATQRISSSTTAGARSNLNDGTLGDRRYSGRTTGNRRGTGLQNRLTGVFQNESRSSAPRNNQFAPQQHPQFITRPAQPRNTTQLESSTLGRTANVLLPNRGRSAPILRSRTTDGSFQGSDDYYDRTDVRLPEQKPLRQTNEMNLIGDTANVVREKSEFASNQESSFVSESKSNPSEMAARIAQQFQLPRARGRSVEEKAVSVLRNRNSQEEVVLTPPENSFDSPIELKKPDSAKPEGFSGAVIDEPVFVNDAQQNMLRSSYPMQDTDEDNQDFQLESPIDDEPELDRESNPLRKSCDEFRAQLLNSPITDIALDISPPGRSDLFGDNVVRTWRDMHGNELIQGSISDLRRGYVIINSTQGGEVRLPYARLGDADWLAVSEYWKLPIECGLGPGTPIERCWAPQTATWYASSLCHKPLYFENVQLERYGHSHGPFLQPVASTVHFFGRLFFLPYNTAIHPPNECQYALGFYRPGNCAPWLRDPFPISLAGAVRQGTFYSGVGFLAE